MKYATSQIFKKISTENKIKVEGQLLCDLQHLLLDMLKDFSSVCEENGFYYSLCGGTALGAVRHQGFIPWDDDVDVFIHRKDLSEFCRIFLERYGDKYDLHSMDLTPELGIPMMRIHRKRTVYVIDDTLDCLERGIFIDVCILEDAPDNRIKRYVHGIGSLYFGFCVSCSRFYSKRLLYRQQFAMVDKEVKKIIEAKILIGRMLSWRSLTNWTRRYSDWNSKYLGCSSRYVVCPTGVKHYFGELFPRNIYLTTKPLRFCDAYFQVIENYDWALKKLYGDYMKIPPEDKRETHYVMDIKLLDDNAL